MKKAFFCLFLTIITAFFGCKHDNSAEIAVNSEDTTTNVAAPIDTMGEIIRRIQLQSRLYTTECHVHKVVLFSDETTVAGRLIDVSLPGHRKAAVPIDVTLKAYVDFGTFSANDVIRQDSLCIINLPDPKVIITSSRVDHEATRQYVSTLRSKFNDAELSRLATQGEDSITAHISQYDIEERARTSCARTIIPILTNMGYKESQIVIRFRKKFTDNDLRPVYSNQK